MVYCGTSLALWLCFQKSTIVKINLMWKRGWKLHPNKYFEIRSTGKPTWSYVSLDFSKMLLKRAHDKYRLLRHVTHLCSTRNRNFKSVFYFIRRVKTLPFQTTFGQLISWNFFWRKKFQNKADKWSFLFSLEIMLKGKRDGVNLWREENSHVSSHFSR